MAGRAGDGGHFQSGQHEGIGAHHGKQQNGLAMLRHDLPDGEEAPYQEGQAHDAPDDGMGLRKKALHNVHGIGRNCQCSQQGGNAGSHNSSALPVGEFGFH